jgi:hypothetical protein
MIGIPQQILSSAIESNNLSRMGLFPHLGQQNKYMLGLGVENWRKGPFWTTRHGSEDNIKVNIKVTELSAVDGIYELRIDINGGLFWTRLWTIGKYKIPEFSELAEKVLPFRGGL